MSFKNEQGPLAQKLRGRVLGGMYQHQVIVSLLAIAWSTVAFPECMRHLALAVHQRQQCAQEAFATSATIFHQTLVPLDAYGTHVELVAIDLRPRVYLCRVRPCAKAAAIGIVCMTGSPLFTYAYNCVCEDKMLAGLRQ